MMDKNTSINELLDDFRSKDLSSEKFTIFSALIEHPDITWKILLEFLDSDSLIKEQAAVLLHSHLKIPKGDELITHRERWEVLLKEKGINTVEKCGKLVETTKYEKP